MGQESSRVTILDACSRVRCTGQRSAIFNRLARCSSSSAPDRCSTRVNWSILPPVGTAPSPESVAANWDAVTNQEGYEVPTQMGDEIGLYLKHLS